MNSKRLFHSFLLVFSISSAFFLVLCQTTWAQNRTNQISGILLDTSDRKPIPLATVAVYSVVDSFLISYRLSNERGSFKIPDLPKDKQLRLVITHGGYVPYRYDFTLTDFVGSVNLDSLCLVKSVQQLEEVIITSEIPPVLIKNDTIEFNANAFKTLPHALVEDLLKKLPGVDVNRDGSITVNGKPVSKIRVDGKEFFAGDIRVATRNLPANMIDKVQVTNDQDQLDLDPELDRNRASQIINLKLKKSIKKGWFGKVYGGGGTNQRYEVGGILNTFADTMQVSFLGYSNNINKAGFGPGDLQELGGFGRSGMNARSVQSGYTINGMSLGGTNEGIQKSTGAGVNFNHDIGKVLAINFQYFLGDINSTFNQKNYMEQRIGDTVLMTNTDSRSQAKDRNHRFGGSAKWKPNTSLVLTYKPVVSLQRQPSVTAFNQASQSNFQDLLNTSQNDGNLEQSKISSSQELTIVKTFRKKGRLLNVSSAFTTGDFDDDLYNSTKNYFYAPTLMMTQTDQLRVSDVDGKRFLLNISYTEPLSKKVTMRLTNAYERFWDRNSISVHHKKVNGDSYDSLDIPSSNDFSRTGWKNALSGNLNWSIGKLRLGTGADWAYIDISNAPAPGKNNGQTKVALFPKISLQSKDWSLTYSARLREPEAVDLQPAINNSNPLILTSGNPNLKVSAVHSFVYSYMKFNYKNGTTWIGYADVNVVRDPTVFARNIGGSGVQTIIPVNIDRNWRTGASLTFSKKIKLPKNSSMLLRASVNPNYASSTAVINDREVDYWNFSMGPSISIDFNFHDVLELNNKYSLAYNKNKYDDPEFGSFKYTTHNLQSELIFRLTDNIVFETSINYFYNSMLNEGLDRSFVIWNGGLNYLFLKNKQGQLRLSVFDLLNQNKAVSRTIKENYLYESQTSILNRYGMLTFLYNIRKFRTQKIGGKNSLFSF